jgi:hypothetical protein
MWVAQRNADVVETQREENRAPPDLPAQRRDLDF